MTTPGRRPGSLGLWPRVWVAIIFLVPLAVSTLKFGRPFLLQFFVSPFQMFMVVPWAFAFYCLKKGFVPLKSGGRIDRATDPRNFWMSVWFYVLIGTACFIFNLCISWLVLSRPR